MDDANMIELRVRALQALMQIVGSLSAEELDLFEARLAHEVAQAESL
jgi:hypothetical protein